MQGIFAERKNYSPFMLKNSKNVNDEIIIIITIIIIIIIIIIIKQIR